MSPRKAIMISPDGKKLSFIEWPLNYPKEWEFVFIFKRIDDLFILACRFHPLSLEFAIKISICSPCCSMSALTVLLPTLDGH